MRIKNKYNTTLKSEGFRLGKLVSAVLSAQLLIPSAQALPEGGQVADGEARIARSAERGSVQVTQLTERAVIDWKTFDIGEKETVSFVQLKPDHVVLNRVNGGSASSILGTLTASGRVFLINPNGVVFGPNAQVNVAGLVASTANISNRDFMAGQYNFMEAGAAGARIINRGEITATDGGLVALIAPGVENAGVIQANLGNVTLASGNVFTLDMFGDGLVSLAVDDEVAEKLVDGDGKPVTALIEQSGRLQADGGNVVLLTAGAAKGVVDNMINMSGVVIARSLNRRPGEIVLHGAGGAVDVGGELNASAPNSAASPGNTDDSFVGGTIKVLGERVHVAETALLDASGGGTVFIGADRSDNERFDRATHTTIDKGAGILADGGEHGDGGEVRLWADDTTAFAGSISARGGDKSGDGGFVEVAAGKTLRFDGTVDVSAPNGKPGTLVKSPEPSVPTPTPTPTDNGTAPPSEAPINTLPTDEPANTSDVPVVSRGDVVVTENGDDGNALSAKPPVPAGQSQSAITSASVRANEAVRVNTTLAQSVDTVLVRPRVSAPLDVIRVELASGFELDDGTLFIPDYRLIPRPDGLREFYIPNPFLLGLYSDMQLSKGTMMLGGMNLPGPGNATPMFFYSGSGAMSGGSSGSGGAGGGSGGVGGGSSGAGSIASAPGRLPQNAQTPAEAVAGEIPGDGAVEIASSSGSDLGAAAAGSDGAPLVVAGLIGDRKSAPGSGRTDGAKSVGGSDGRRMISARVAGHPCAGDGKSAGTQAEHQLSEFTLQTGEAAKAALTRHAGEGPCAQGGGAARERARGNQSFVAYGLVNGGRGVAQAADLGRNSPVSGAVSDVFRVSYHVLNAPRYARGLGLRNNYFCTSPFGENVCARALAFNKLSALERQDAIKP